MTKTYLKIVIFALLLIGFFVFIGEALTKISGMKSTAGAAVGVNPEAGEAIFWGKGKCGTCHSVGGQGSVVRCPNLDNIGLHAEERAAKREQKSATDYLVESIAEPSAYIVENYKNEMPLVYEPPIALEPEEIMAAITYLQSLGGEVDVAEIKLPDKILRASAEPPKPWEPYLAGNPEVGELLFFDEQSNAGCGQCHTVIDSTGAARGGNVGPELTHVAGTRTPQFIIKSIVDPSAEIASGFETVLIITKNGRYLDGIRKREDETAITIARREGDDLVEMMIARNEIESINPQPVSMMPSGLAEIVTLQEFHDILAYLLTLQ